MTSSLKIRGYRCFEHFEMPDLGRVNLLVGTNNSGKTSVLEAIHLLALGTDTLALRGILDRRGERSFVETADLQGARIRTLLEVSHLFAGHDASPGASFEISGQRGFAMASVHYSVGEHTERPAGLASEPEDDQRPVQAYLTIREEPLGQSESLRLTGEGSTREDRIDAAGSRFRRPATDSRSALFITTESLSPDSLVRMWNSIVLGPTEDFVLKALRHLEPDIERIAAIAPPRYAWERKGGFVVKRMGYPQPVPIGSMGDGMWRMLALALAITQCRGGVLLVDEIDTGLHYTVMSRMWDLIASAARDLDVQVFATTHSYDCIHSLAQLCSVRGTGEAVTIQRIERGKLRSVPYDEDEIRSAASRDIEVR